MKNRSVNKTVKNERTVKPPQWRSHGVASYLVAFKRILQLVTNKKIK